MGLIGNIVCFLLGWFIGVAAKGEFTVNYKHTYKDETTQYVPVENPIGYEKPEQPEEDQDSPAEIAAKIQEAIGVFINDESEERK